MKRSLNDIAKEVREFSQARGWWNEKPTQLIASMLIELGELSEYYQWENDFSKIKKLSEKEKTALGFEFFDVLFFAIG